MESQIQEIEQPMHMNYREAYAWQLGYDMGWKQAQKEFLDKIDNLIDHYEPYRPITDSQESKAKREVLFELKQSLGVKE